MQSFSFGTTPEKLIKESVREQCSQGFEMQIKSQDEWDAIVEAVAVGIDSHLEALTERSTFDAGDCSIHPDELHVLLRRLGEQGSEEADSLRSGILYCLGIEEI